MQPRPQSGLRNWSSHGRLTGDFPSNRVRVMVATKPIDFRKGHDRLAAMVKNKLRKDLFTGTVFVFRA